MRTICAADVKKVNDVSMKEHTSLSSCEPYHFRQVQMGVPAVLHLGPSELAHQSRSLNTARGSLVQHFDTFFDSSFYLVVALSRCAAFVS